MQIILFEDYLVGEIRPVTLGRAAFTVGMGGTNLYDLVKRKSLPVSYLVREYLREITLRNFSNEPLGRKDLLFLNASLPPSVGILEKVLAQCEKNKAFVAQTDHRVAAAFFPDLDFSFNQVDEISITNFLLAQEYEVLEDRFPLINYPFDIIKYNQAYFEDNLQHIRGDYENISSGVYVGKDTKIHPTVCLNSEEGTIVIGDGVSIGPFVYLQGPLYLGSHSRIIERTSIKEFSHIDHTCKIGGEIEASVVESYSNKQHHGFLGHSYVGSWVNMGAGTSNSDLKNTYGKISVVYRGEVLDTGKQFLGCIIGNYSKTAINTSIFTGKVIGVSSYVYGFVTGNVPSFCNYAKSFGQVTEYYLSSAIRTQERMFARRGIKQEQVHIKLLEDIYQLTRDERMMSTESLFL